MPRKSSAWLASGAFALAAQLAPSFALAYDWLQFNGGPAHSGDNQLETIINVNNVGQLLQKFQVSLPDVADGAPVFLENVTTSSGPQNLLFVTTRDGHIIALNAQTGATVWSHQHGPGTCTINNGGSVCYTTSSPAIDPNRLYVYSYGLDGFVHKYGVGNGTEVTTGGWPELATLKGFDEKGSSALSIATSKGTSYLYVTNGGYPGDNGDYQGHVTAINLATGAQKVFNTQCSDQTVHFVEQPGSPDCSSGVQSAIWARPGTIYDAGTDLLFVATGNATFDPANFLWGDSILALHPDATGAGTGNPVDSYTPTDFQTLQNNDADLGSTAPAILPVPASSKIQHLAVQGGKDALLRLVDLANLSGQGGPGNTGGEIDPIPVPQGGEVLSQPAVWVNPADGSTWVFVGNSSGLSGLRLAIDASGNPSLVKQWQIGTQGAQSSPLVANNILFFFGSAHLTAYDPTTAKQLWTSGQVGGTHWESPIVANGMVYLTDESGKLSGFAIGGAGINVDARGGTGTSSNVNGILEPGETVFVDPSWTNFGASTVHLTGTATKLTGPSGATYTINANSADYGSIAPGATANCFTATGTCYRITVSNPATRPVRRWEISLQETLSTGGTVTMLLHVGDTFSDVPVTDLLYRYVEALVRNQVTEGYANGTYLPGMPGLRAHIDMFTARALVAPDGDPAIPASGSVGASAYNCVSGGVSLFADVQPTDVWCKQIHYLAATGVDVTFQCADSAHACPDVDTTRAATAVVVAGAMAGGDASVPASGTFSDTGSPRSYNCSSGGSSHFPDVLVTDAFCRHVNYLWARGVVSGFSDGTFGPALDVTRDQLAKFVVNGFHLSVYGP
jgi:outer membrane protein assembly factor BamB